MGGVDWSGLERTGEDWRGLEWEPLCSGLADVEGHELLYGLHALAE